jgi:hypothetical protein
MGFVTPHKRLDRALAALGRLAREGIAFHLIIAGQISDELPYRIEERIAAEGLDSRVSVRGYVKRAELFELLSAADLAINLRYPTAGESSASLIQFLGCGVPTLITDHGVSAELPDAVAAKIPWDEREAAALTDTLRYLLTHPEEREALGSRARAHVLAHHSLQRVVERYLAAIETTAADAALRMVRRAEKSLVSLLDPLRLHPRYGELRRRIVERWNGRVRPPAGFEAVTPASGFVTPDGVIHARDGIRRGAGGRARGGT